MPLFSEYLVFTLIILGIYGALAVWDYFVDGQTPCPTNWTMVTVISLIPIVNAFVAICAVIVLAAWGIILVFLRVFG